MYNFIIEIRKIHYLIITPLALSLNRNKWDNSATQHHTAGYPYTMKIFYSKRKFHVFSEKYIVAIPPDNLYKVTFLKPDDLIISAILFPSGKANTDSGKYE